MSKIAINSSHLKQPSPKWITLNFLWPVPKCPPQVLKCSSSLQVLLASKSPKCPRALQILECSKYFKSSKCSVVLRWPVTDHSQWFSCKRTVDIVLTSVTQTKSNCRRGFGFGETNLLCYVIWLSWTLKQTKALIDFLMFHFLILNF